MEGRKESRESVSKRENNKRGNDEVGSRAVTLDNQMESFQGITNSLARLILSLRCISITI